MDAKGSTILLSFIFIVVMNDELNFVVAFVVVHAKKKNQAEHKTCYRNGFRSFVHLKYH